MIKFFNTFCKRIKLFCFLPGLILLAGILHCETIAARKISVASVSALQTAIGSAVPGDTIVAEDGVYTTTGSITISKQGTAVQPIVIMARNIGGAELNGSGGFILASPSKYIKIQGFKFTHNTGTASIQSGATFCQISRNLYECVANGTGNKAYLNVSGDDNEISYNTFQNKSTEGCMVTIQGPGSDKMAKRTWVHHNYFNNFMPSGANNSSAIQIGLSSRSMDSAFSVIEYNFFYKTRGENEGAICHKSSRNIIRYNTFGELTEEMSLRHGNKSEVYGNFFIGSTGLRFSGDDHKIYSNFFKGCSDAIDCTNGDGEVADGSALTCHDRPDRVLIVYNTLVDCGSNFQMPSRTNGLGATNITFANNIIQGGGAISIRTPGPYVSPVWSNNILWNTTGGSMPTSGYTTTDPKMTADASGVYHLLSGSPAIGAGAGAYSFVNLDIDGHPRTSAFDVGADQFSTIPATNRPLTATDVGTLAGLGLVAPAAPDQLTATAVSSTQINLSWTDNSTDENSFSIERSGDGSTWTVLGLVAANTVTYSNTGLIANATYLYRVKAVGTYMGSDYSNAATITTLSNSPLENLAYNKTVVASSEPQPENPASAIVDNNTTTRWAASVFPQWIEVDLGDIKSVSKTELVCYGDRAYQYTVEVKAGATDAYIKVVDRGTNTTPGTIAAPLSDNFTSVNARYVKLTITGCAVYTGTWATIYEFRVFGLAMSMSVPQSPSSLVATTVSNAQVNLAWADNSDNEYNFVVERSVDNTNWITIATLATGATSYNNTGLTANTKYYYRVSASNPAGSSVPSGVAEATTTGLSVNDMYNSNIGFNYKVVKPGNTIAFTYSLPGKTNVLFTISDIKGLRIATLVEGNQVPGEYTSYLDIDRMPAGIYMAIIIAGNKSKVIKFIVSK